MFSRRKFIKVGAASVSSLALRNFGALPAFAQSASSDYQALVCIFLFGGNDSNNMIIPENQFNRYTTIRGTDNLALSTSELKLVTDKHSNGIYFNGLLPNLANLFSSGTLAVAANVGALTVPIQKKNLTNVPANLFSHADQQAEWQTSDPTELVKPVYGWGGRAAGVVQAANGTFPTLILVAGNDLYGVGPDQQFAFTAGSKLTLDSFDYTLKQPRSEALQSLLTTDTGLTLYGVANGVMSGAIQNAKILSDALTGVSLNTQFDASAGLLGQQLEQVALIMKANQLGVGLNMKKQIFFCSLGGFDTHTGELETHAKLYPQLDGAIHSFWEALDEIKLQQNVVVFTESEFSRTMQPTTTDGSDHAWGSHHMVLGANVKGQAVYNSFPDFVLGGDDDYDTRGRWIPTAAVDQYGASLINWFGITDAKDVATVFPNLSKFPTNPLKFFG